MTSRLNSFLAGLALVGVVAAFWVPETIGAPDADLCRPGYAREHQLAPAQYYPIAKEAYRRAGIPWSDRSGYRLDHIRPICLGGTWDQSNLQVQTIEAAADKDRREWAACRAYCNGDITLDAARAEFTRTSP